MADVIAQRQVRNDNAEIMRRVEAGESFVITRNGTPIADLVPHAAVRKPRLTARELQERARRLPPMDRDTWYADRAADDLLFGDDRIDS
ncbi:MAG: type II toxin-antitoxin system Phd/YefM family antitoxin [Pseudonocardia sp.]